MIISTLRCILLFQFSLYHAEICPSFKYKQLYSTEFYYITGNNLDTCLTCSTRDCEQNDDDCDDDFSYTKKIPIYNRLAQFGVLGFGNVPARAFFYFYINERCSVQGEIFHSTSYSYQHTEVYFEDRMLYNKYLRYDSEAVILTSLAINSRFNKLALFVDASSDDFSNKKDKQYWDILPCFQNTNISEMFYQIAIPINYVDYRKVPIKGEDFTLYVSCSTAGYVVNPSNGLVINFENITFDSYFASDGLKEFLGIKDNDTFPSNPKKAEDFVPVYIEEHGIIIPYSEMVTDEEKEVVAKAKKSFNNKKLPELPGLKDDKCYRIGSSVFCFFHRYIIED